MVLVLVWLRKLSDQAVWLIYAFNATEDCEYRHVSDIKLDHCILCCLTFGVTAGRERLQRG